jgi:hypothetical protein
MVGWLLVAGVNLNLNFSYGNDRRANGIPKRGGYVFGSGT